MIIDFSIVTGILVTNKKGEVLLVKKANNEGPFSGTYLTPGGGVLKGEDIDQAVLRELYEETGVKVNNLKRVFFDGSVTENWKGELKHFIMLLYTGTYTSGELKTTEGNDDTFEDVAWFSTEQLKTVPLSPPLKKLLLFLGYRI